MTLRGIKDKGLSDMTPDFLFSFIMVALYGPNSKKIKKVMNLLAALSGLLITIPTFLV